MPNLAARTDAELREWCQEIVKNLGYLLSAKKDEEVKRRFQILGRMRHEQGFPMTVLQLYAERELEGRMGRFFDASVYQMVRGYESARRVAQRLAS